MKYDIFISYRREGGLHTAKHIYDLLVRDNYRVSFDIDTLRNGDFDIELLKRIDECTDFILILNRGVFDRCLQSNIKEDWLRQELAYALEKNKNIIPIMLSDFREFPKNLPNDIERVKYKNGPKFDTTYFDAFYEKLKQFFISHPIQIDRFSTQSNNYILKVKPNLTCEMWIDGNRKAKIESGEIKQIPLQKGTFWLEFISVKNKKDRYEQQFDLFNPEELIVVDLLTIQQEREKYMIVAKRTYGLGSINSFGQKVVDPWIIQGSELPCTKQETFYTYKEGQTSFSFTIYELDSIYDGTILVENALLLDEVTINFEPCPQGTPIRFCMTHTERKKLKIEVINNNTNEKVHFEFKVP